MIFKRYWPWLIPLGFVAVYETVALLTPLPTLSALVWEADAHLPWLEATVIVGLVVLVWHFFFQKR
jgi:hypothetical protein